MKLQIRVPMAEGTIITETAAKALIGKQWATLLFAGQSALGAVTDAMALAEGRILWLELEAEEFSGMSLANLATAPENAPVTEATAPAIQLDWSQVRTGGTHINCPHDPAGMNLENAMVCDGPR